MYVSVQANNQNVLFAILLLLFDETKFSTSQRNIYLILVLKFIVLKPCKNDLHISETIHFWRSQFGQSFQMHNTMTITQGYAYGICHTGK